MNEIIFWVGLGVTIFYIVVSIIYMVQLNRMVTHYREIILFYRETCNRLEDKRKYNRPKG